MSSRRRMRIRRFVSFETITSQFFYCLSLMKLKFFPTAAFCNKNRKRADEEVSSINDDTESNEKEEKKEKGTQILEFVL